MKINRNIGAFITFPATDSEEHGQTPEFSVYIVADGTKDSKQLNFKTTHPDLNLYLTIDQMKKIVAWAEKD